MTASTLKHASLGHGDLYLSEEQVAETEDFIIRCASSLRDLGSFETDWTELYDSLGIPTPNADYRHYVSTVEAFGNAHGPYVTLFADPRRPRAMIVARRSMRPIRFRLGYLSLPSPRLRCLDIVYGGLITGDSITAAERVVDHIRDLIRQGEIDHVMINHLPLSHPAYSGLIDAGAIARPIQPHWSLRLSSDSLDSTLSFRSSKHRRKLRRFDRNLVRDLGDTHLRILTEPSEVDEFVRIAGDITQRTYQASLGGGVTDQALTRKVFEVEAKRGRFRSYLLVSSGRVIAFQAGFICRNTYVCRGKGYLPQYASHRPGNILLMRLIEDLCSLGVGALDHGFGDAEYKRLYGTDCEEEATLHLYSNSTRARLARALDLASSRTESLISSSSRVSGLRSKLKTKWRRIMQRSV